MIFIAWGYRVVLKHATLHALVDELHMLGTLGGSVHMPGLLGGCSVCICYHMAGLWWITEFSDYLQTPKWPVMPVDYYEKHECTVEHTDYLINSHKTAEL